MPDILIRDVAAEDIAALDAQARSAGLSRTEFLRRTLRQQAQAGSKTVQVQDLQDMAQLLRGLEDEDLMRDAWS